MSDDDAPSAEDRLVLTQRILWFALFGGVVAFSGVVILLTVLGAGAPAELDPATTGGAAAAPATATGGAAPDFVLYVVGIVLAVGGLGASFLIRRFTPTHTPDSQFLSESLRQFRFLLPMALLEGPALYSVVIVLLTNSFLPFVIVAPLLVAMVLLFPQRATPAGDQGDERDNRDAYRSA